MVTRYVIHPMDVVTPTLIQLVLTKYGVQVEARRGTFSQTIFEFRPDGTVNVFKLDPGAAEVLNLALDPSGHIALGKQS